MAIIEQSPKLIKLVRTASNYYDNKNKMNMQLLKDNLGFMTYNVEDRMLTRAIANLRKKFVNDNTHKTESHMAEHAHLLLYRLLLSLQLFYTNLLSL